MGIHCGGEPRFPVGISQGCGRWASPQAFFGSSGLYIVGFLFFLCSSVFSSVFLDRVLLTHTDTQTHTRHTHEQTQDTHTPTAQANVCFFIDTYLMKLKAVKVNTINIIQNNIYNIFSLILFISLQSFLLIVSK